MREKILQAIAIVTIVLCMLLMATLVQLGLELLCRSGGQGTCPCDHPGWPGYDNCVFTPK